MGQIDDAWTFSAQAGGSITIVVNPGSGGSTPAFSPQLGWVSVELIAPNGTVLASANNTGSGVGSIVQLSDVALMVSGTYTIQVQAPSSEASSTGNYVLTIVAAPDLVVSNIANPAIGLISQPVKISWTDANQGGADVTNGWDDQVFASPDGQLSDAILLGDFPEVGALPAGSSVNVTNMAGDALRMERPGPTRSSWSPTPTVRSTRAQTRATTRRSRRPRLT